MVCHALLQGIVPTQGLNPCLLYLLIGRRVLYCQHHLGSPWWIGKKMDFVVPGPSFMGVCLQGLLEPHFPSYKTK